MSRNTTPFPGEDVGRSLPHSDEAERCLLGSLLLMPAKLPEVEQLLGRLGGADRGADAFYNENHRLIYRVICDMDAQHQPIDFSTVTMRLRTLNQLDCVGGAAAVTQLANAVPTAGNAVWYADIVANRKKIRNLIEFGTQVVADSYDLSDGAVNDFTTRVYQLAAVLNRSNASTLVHVRDAMDEVQELVDRMLASTTPVKGIDTGFREWNEILGGLVPASYNILAARPSVGKTTLATNVARFVAGNATEYGGPVGIWSLEQATTEIIMRTLAADSGVNVTKLWSLTPEGKQDAAHRLGSAMMELRNANLYIDDTGDISSTELRARARQAVAQHGLKLIVVDYLGLMRSTTKGRNASDTEIVSAVSADMKALAKETGVPVLVLCQLNRGTEESNARPKLSNLRQSGSIEQDADTVTLLSILTPRDAEEISDLSGYRHLTAEQCYGFTLAHVAKNRNGERGYLVFGFNRETTRYFEPDGPPPVVGGDAADIPPAPVVRPGTQPYAD